MTRRRRCPTLQDRGLLAAFVVARHNRRVALAVFAAMLTLACCEIGYVLATELRGGTQRHFDRGLLAHGGAPWLVHRSGSLERGPPRPGCVAGSGLSVLGGVLVGEGLYGRTTVADTTDWRYWIVELVIGAIALSFPVVALRAVGLVTRCSPSRSGLVHRDPSCSRCSRPTRIGDASFRRYR